MSQLFRQRADGRVFLEEETICANKLYQKRREKLTGTVKTLELKGGEYSPR